MATPGMRVMDLKMRLTDSARVPFLTAAVHAVLFYVSTMFPPVFLVSLRGLQNFVPRDVIQECNKGGIDRSVRSASLSKIKPL